MRNDWGLNTTKRLITRSKLSVNTKNDNEKKNDERDDISKIVNPVILFAPDELMSIPNVVKMNKPTFVFNIPR